MNCVILANGQFPQCEEALDTLRTADYICCCDGAVEKLLAAGFVPDVIVGDGDSIPVALQERFADIFIKIDEQEYNDLTKATHHCVRKGYSSITYLGATGLREDHTIGNVFLLPFYLERFAIHPTMITDEGTFTAWQGKNTIQSHAGQQVSLFNISCSRLESQGLRWDAYPFTQLWQGTLNESLGEQFTLDGDGIYIVFLLRRTACSPPPLLRYATS